VLNIARSKRLIITRLTNRKPSQTGRLLLFNTMRFLRVSTPRKLVNFGVVKIERALRRDRLWGMPYRFHVDTLNACNLRCPLCPTGLGTLQRPRGKMSMEQFQHVVDQIAPYAYYLNLYNWGEPLLHPEICDMIRYATDKGITVSISSNLNRMNAALAENLVQSGLSEIIVSVDGASQEAYEKYRRGGRLSVVLENLSRLAEAKQRSHRSAPFILVRMLIHKHNEHEIAALRETVTALGADSFTTHPLFIDPRNPEHRQEWLPEDESKSFYDYSAETMENTWDCADLWESCTINWDGGLAPCCWLQNPAHDMANILETPLRTIWNGDAYVSSRRVFSVGGPKPGPQKTICTKCRGRPEYLTY